MVNPLETTCLKADVLTPYENSYKEGASWLPHTSVGHLLSQVDLLLPSKEEADRPGTGVGC